MTAPSDPVRARLAEISERVDRATEGPWEWEDRAMPGSTVNEWFTRQIVHPNRPYHQLNVLKVRAARHASRQCCWAPHTGDVEFITEARTDVPALLAVVTAVLDLHQPQPVHGECGHTDTPDGLPAAHARYTGGGIWVCGEPTGQVCAECCDEDGTLVRFPCDTYRAVSAALGVTE